MKNIVRRRMLKKPIGYRFYVALLGLSLGFTAWAEQVQTPKTVSLVEAVKLTLEHHPDLRAFAPQQRMWEGRIQQAGVGERPQIGFMVEDALGTGDHSGFKSMQSTLTFSWLLQQEQVASRVNAAKSEATNLVLEKQIKALDLSALVTKLYVEILVKQERLKLNLLAKKQAQEVVKTIAKRVQVGKSLSVEEQLAKAELLRTELAVEDLEHELKASRYKLAALWGQPASNYSLNGDLLDIPATPDVDKQLALLKQNPRLQQFASAQRIAQSQMELARIEAKSQWQFTAGVRRYETTDDYGVVAGITIPWGDSNRNAGTIAALQAQQEVLDSERAALMQQLDTQLYVLLQEMNHSQHVIKTMNQAVIPTLDQALREAENAFNRGQFSYNQFNTVRQELLNAQGQLLDAFASLHFQHIEIQRLTGSSISQ